jgi:hypothetical protein
MLHSLIPQPATSATTIEANLSENLNEKLFVHTAQFFACSSFFSSSVDVMEKGEKTKLGGDVSRLFLDCRTVR